MQSVRSNGGYLKICSLLPEQRKGIFDLVQFTDQKQLPVFWIKIRLGRGLITFSVAGIKTWRYNTYMLRWSYKTI